MEKHIAIVNSFKFGWEKTRAHSMLVFQVVLAIFALEVVRAIVERVLHNSALGGLASFALWVLSVFVGVGATLISLRLVRGQHTTHRDLLPDWKLVWKFFVAGICAGFVMAIPLIVAGAYAAFRIVHAFGFDGLETMFRQMQYGDPVMQKMYTSMLFGSIGAVGYVLFAIAIIASAYLALRYSMVRFAVLDGSGITDSLRRSAKLTHGVKWQLLGFTILAALLNIVGAILFFVGLLVTVPVTMLAFAHIYDKLH
jgi:hypothetical protein